MREIQFRGYAIEKYEGSNWFYGGICMNYDDKLAYIDSPGNGLVPVKWESVGQYTGLKDKNGKGIYEGDVVDTVYDGKLFTGVVIYDESELDFKATNGEENYGSNFQYLPCCDEVEVIGNIYENPDLLKWRYR